MRFTFSFQSDWNAREVYHYVRNNDTNKGGNIFALHYFTFH